MLDFWIILSDFKFNSKLFIEQFYIFQTSTTGMLTAEYIVNLYIYIKISCIYIKQYSEQLKVLSVSLS